MTSPPLKPPTRRAFVKHCLELIHTPYIYGARSRDGVDCWGLIALAWDLAGGGATYFKWWTDVGWQKLEEVKGIPEPGELAFYGGKGKHDVSHVMVTLWDGMLIGASGGDASTKTLLEAMKRGAKVKVIENGKAYDIRRGDFRGFRRLPFAQEE